jgi:predicted nucleotidyltransferase
MADFGLPEPALKFIRSVLADYPEVERAIIYGSRAKGNYRKGSDIDMTLVGEGLDYRVLGAIAGRLQESPIPYQVDLSIRQHIDSPSLLEHIERVGKVFYKQPGKAPS